MQHQQDFVPRQLVCLFWPHDGAFQHLYFVVRLRVCFFWRHDGASAFVIRCTPACQSCLPTRWRNSTLKPSTASCVFFLTARWRTSAQRQLKTPVRTAWKKRRCRGTVRGTRRRDGQHFFMFFFYNYTPLHSTTLDYTKLHYTTLHYTTLHSTTLHYTSLHYTTLPYTEWHCTTDRQVDR